MKSNMIKKLHKKHIENLNEQIRDLENQNNVLSKKNTLLEQKLLENNRAISLIKAQTLRVKDEYERTIEEVKELKSEYEQLIKEVIDERKKFKKESSNYLKQLKKQL